MITGDGVVAPYNGDEEWNPWEAEQADDISALLNWREAFRQYTRSSLTRTGPRDTKFKSGGKLP